MLDRLKAVIAEQLNMDENTIDMNCSLKDDLGADSLDIFELVMALEEEYELEIPNEDLMGLDTVGDVMQYLASRGIEE